MVTIKLAGIPIQMNNRFSHLEWLCRGYETLEAPRMIMEVSDEELRAEQKVQEFPVSDGYLETVCLYRQLALEILAHQVFLMHAAIVEVDGEGYGFLAPSGTGKTTQLRLWLEHFGDRARVINGDKPLIRMVREGETPRFVAYGTPWCGKEGLNTNASVPLKGLFLVERAEVPTCVPADPALAVQRVFRQLLLPKQKQQMNDLLTMVDGLMETVPVYRLCCDMTDASVEAAWNCAHKA